MRVSHNIAICNDYFSGFRNTFKPTSTCCFVKGIGEILSYCTLLIPLIFQKLRKGKNKEIAKLFFNELHKFTALPNVILKLQGFGHLLTKTAAFLKDGGPIRRGNRIDGIEGHEGLCRAAYATYERVSTVEGICHALNSLRTRIKKKAGLERPAFSSSLSFLNA